MSELRLQNREGNAVLHKVDYNIILCGPVRYCLLIICCANLNHYHHRPEQPSG
jgi:hypothetical protein